jgi:hypothetical protein
MNKSKGIMNARAVILKFINRIKHVKIKPPLSNQLILCLGKILKLSIFSFEFMKKMDKNVVNIKKNENGDSKVSLSVLII